MALTVRDKAPSYRTMEEMIVAASEAVRPPERLSVAEAAAKYVYIKEKSYSGPWKADKVPYMVEPQEILTSLDYTGMIFVGPARTGKSQAWLNWLAHSALCDPADMMLVQMSLARAREFSLSDLAKLLRNSPKIREKLVPGRQNDNVFDKTFLSGMRATITYPSINELSGKTSGRNWSMDYDRVDDDIDGEGDLWTLMTKRSQTLGRYAMNVAESSPGRPVTDAKWLPSSPHEAPPTGGILSIYNTGDRRRWYWDCPQCHGKFEPDFHLLQYPKSRDPMESSEQVKMICPHNGCVLAPDTQYDLNLGGKWIADGEQWLEDGSVIGQARRSNIASYWLKGPAAGFMTWPELVLKYLNAVEQFERTGEETSLKSTTNVDQGLPYTPKALEAGKLPEELKARARPYNRRGTVPQGVRFLITTIDVQAGGRPSFVCHTYGIAPIQLKGGAWSVDIYHIDMWKIEKSRRTDEDEHPKLIDPAAYKEDWHILIDEVIERAYPLDDDSGRFMKVKLVACDSGGAASATAVRLNAALDGPTVSVTSNAYDFWRFLRDDHRGHHQRFHLLKGEPSRTAPSIHVTYPDSQQKDRFAIARGDVPVWAVNSNVVKDQAAALRDRDTSGGSVQYPIWYDEEGREENIDWLYKQLTAEVRLPAGWKNMARRRNEAFDLLAYCVAFFQHPQIRLPQIRWENPPRWAGEWEQNDMVFGVSEEASEIVEKPKAASISDLAGQFG